MAFDLNDYNEEQIEAARHYAANVHIEHASMCLEPGYFADHVSLFDMCAAQFAAVNMAKRTMEGCHDNDLATHQRMEYYLTGKSTPLLS